MSGLRPFIEVSVDGNPVTDFFYSRLVSATIHDAPGQEADNCEFRFDDAGNDVPIPDKGAVLLCRMGFRDPVGAALVNEKMGVFTYEKTQIVGGEQGKFLVISGRSADMRSDVKEPVSEHFDDTTIGGIVSELAKRHGYEAKLDDELSNIPIPYIARLNQGTGDFLTRLADRYGALFAPKDGKFIFVRHGTLAPVVIDRSECVDWSFEVEPRPVYGKTEAGWFDRTKGEVAYESASTGLTGATRRLRRVLPTKDEAAAAAKSEGQRLARATGSGSITLAGRPDIMADAPIITTGWRPEANGLWRCAGVDHVFDETYTTAIEIEAPEEGKS